MACRLVINYASETKLLTEFVSNIECYYGFKININITHVFNCLLKNKIHNRS